MATETATITATGVCLNGIVTDAEYITFAGAGYTTIDVQATAAILDATEFIMNHLGRWFVLTAEAITVVEQFNGNGRNMYFPHQGPILTVGTIQWYNGSTWEAVDTTIYRPETDGNRIFFRGNQIFWKGNKNWRVTYTFGYASIPRDLKRACMMIARHYIGTAPRDPDLQAQSDGEQSFTYRGTRKVPDDAMTIVERYRRFGTSG